VTYLLIPLETNFRQEKNRPPRPDWRKPSALMAAAGRGGLIVGAISTACFPCELNELAACRGPCFFSLPQYSLMVVNSSLLVPLKYR